MYTRDTLFEAVPKRGQDRLNLFERPKKRPNRPEVREKKKKRHRTLETMGAILADAAASAAASPPKAGAAGPSLEIPLRGLPLQKVFLVSVCMVFCL